MTQPAGAPLGVYVHVPFCAARCHYCAFYTRPRHPEQETHFVQAVVAEIERVARKGRDVAGGIAPLAGRSVDSIFLGGGTPSLLPAADLESILQRLADVFRLTDDAEITLEANPETVNARNASEWTAMGINRVSLGAQSFDGRTLEDLQRTHGVAQIAQGVRHLRRAGLGSVSLDLIAGICPEALESDIRQACALQTEHLSVYLLEVDEHEVGGVTPLARRHAAGRRSLPDADWYADAYPVIVAMLADAGLHRYEICNFARPGCESRHNRKYWLGEEVVGFGPAAHSLLQDVRHSSTPDLDGYLAAASRDADPAMQVDSCSAAERRAEQVILALRLDEGVPEGALASLGALQREAACEMEAAGLLVGQGGRIRLSERGILLSNEVFQRLLPAAQVERAS